MNYELRLMGILENKNDLDDSSAVNEFPTIMPEAHEATLAVNEAFRHFESLVGLYQEMKKIQENVPLTLESVNHYRARADYMLNEACIDAAYPALESLEDANAAWTVTMEGISDGARKVLTAIGAGLKTAGRTLTDGANFITISAKGTLKSIEKARARVEAGGDALKESTIPMGVGRALIQADGQRRYPTVNDIAHYSEHVTRWSDLNVLVRAIGDLIGEMHGEGKRNSKSNRVAAVQEAIIEHYGLVIDKDASATLTGKLMGVFRKEPIKSDVAVMGGLKIEGVGGIGESDSGFGRLFVSDLNATVDVKGITRGKDHDVVAPTKKQMLDVLDSLSDLMENTSMVRNNFSDAKKMLDVYAAEIKKLSKLSSIDWAQFIAGTAITSLPGLGSAQWAIFIMKIMKRYTNTIAKMSGVLSRDTISMTLSIIEATDIAAKNLE